MSQNEQEAPVPRSFEHLQMKGGRSSSDEASFPTMRYTFSTFNLNFWFQVTLDGDFNAGEAREIDMTD